MTLRAFLIVIATALVVSSCGGGGGSTTAGGIGGTGVSYGPVTGFGSVIVNGVEYDTTSADFSVEGSATGIDQSDLAVGMVVSVTHDDNGNAKSVSYKDDAEGPISNLNAAGNTFDVLGVSVTVDALTVYDGITNDLNLDGTFDINDLANDDIVEVSGQITADNTVVATRVELKGDCSTLGAGEEIEVKGTVTVVDADTFTIGSLTVSFTSHGLVNGDYVEVKSDTCPVGGILTATSIEAETEGPDTSDLDEGEDGMEIEGTATLQSGSGTDCLFTINGQNVSTSISTMVDGVVIADCTTLDGTLVEAEGQLVGGTLEADQISSEDSADDADGELSGEVIVLNQTGLFDGTITVGVSADIITVDINTVFDGESQDFNLGTMAAAATCAEVKYNTGTMTAISIEEESCI